MHYGNASFPSYALRCLTKSDQHFILRHTICVNFQFQLSATQFALLQDITILWDLMIAHAGKWTMIDLSCLDKQVPLQGLRQSHFRLPPYPQQHHLKLILLPKACFTRPLQHTYCVGVLCNLLTDLAKQYTTTIGCAHLKHFIHTTLLSYIHYIN